MIPGEGVELDTEALGAAPYDFTGQVQLGGITRQRETKLDRLVDVPGLKLRLREAPLSRDETRARESPLNRWAKTGKLSCTAHANATPIARIGNRWTLVDRRIGSHLQQKGRAVGKGRRLR